VEKQNLNKELEKLQEENDNSLSEQLLLEKKRIAT
jgi:hypothetical protein